MPFEPPTNLVPQIIGNAAGELGQALGEYRKRQDQRASNTAAFETILSQYPKAVPPDVVAKFHDTTNPNAQSGIIVQLMNKINQANAQANAVARIGAKLAPFQPVINSVPTPDGGSVNVFQSGPRESHIIPPPAAPKWAPAQADIDRAAAQGMSYFQTTNGWELKPNAKPDFDPTTFMQHTLPGSITQDNPAGTTIVVDKNNRLVPSQYLHHAPPANAMSIIMGNGAQAPIIVPGGPSAAPGSFQAGGGVPAAGNTPAPTPAPTPTSVPGSAAPGANIAPTGTNPGASGTGVSAGGQVQVVSPDGIPGLIPAANLQAALAAGYTQP